MGNKLTTLEKLENSLTSIVLSNKENLFIELNSNNPPSVNQYSSFVFFDSSNNIKYVFETSDQDFTWSTGNFPAQSDGTWYLWIEDTVDGGSTIPDEGVYGASQNVPSYDQTKGGWYNSDGKVLARFTSSSGTVSNLVIYYSNSSKNGLYTGKGVEFDGTQYIVLKPGKFELNNEKIIEIKSDINIVDLTGQSSNTWYVICIKESDGIIDVKLAGKSGSGGDFDNWTISGNQLNMSSIYDKERNYCRDSISGIWYRIINVYNTNSTPNNIQPRSGIHNIKNKPKSYIFCTSNAGQTIGTGSATIINFEDIEVDINSEVTVGASWKITANGTKKFDFSGGIRIDDTWTAGQIYYGQIWYNGSNLEVTDIKEIEANGTFITFTKIQGKFILNHNGYIDWRFYQDSGSDVNLYTDTRFCWLQAVEIE